MPKLEFTPLELKNYFGIEVKYRHCFYEKSVVMADTMLVHADGIYPCKLLDERRPNEPMEVMEYRKKIFVPKTKPYFGKIVSSLQKIRRSSDWSIRYEGDFPKIPEGETLKDYTELYYPQFTSITNWVFAVLLKKYLTDPNAIMFCYPKEVGGEVNKYLQPIINVIDSCHVLDYVYQDYAVFVNPAGCWYETSKGKLPGKSFYVVTTERITRYDQIDGRGTLSPVLDYLHGLEELPVYKIGAIICASNGEKLLYESRVSGIIPEFDEAIREYSDLQASVVIHMYPERWEYTQEECAVCKGTGKRRNPLWFDSCGAETPCDLPCDNKACRNGYVVAGPYSKMMIRPLTAMEGQGNIPNPPAGYIEKDVEIIKLQQESVMSHITNGLASINFEFIAMTPLSQSGVAKEVDKDELNNTVHSIAEDIVRCMDWGYWMIARYRYGVVYGLEDIEAMLPHIAVPEKYDILSSSHLEEQLKNLKESKANPVITNAVEVEYANKAFNNDPSIRDLVRLVLELDPLANISEDDKMTRLANKGITLETYVISSNIQEFVQRAIEADEGFPELDTAKQKEIIAGYAKELVELVNVDLIPIEEIPPPEEKPIEDDPAVITNADIGKLPLALQQLALAKTRSIADGDNKLADLIEAKMKQLIEAL